MCIFTLFNLSRKKYAKRQSILHSYGQDDESSDGESGDETDEGRDPQALVPNINNDVLLSIPDTASRKPCKCGSLLHSRISHRDCPLKKRK